MNAFSAVPPLSEPTDPHLAHCREVLVRSVDIMAELQEMALADAKAGHASVAEAVAQVDTLSRSIRRSAMLVERLGRPVKPLSAHRVVARREVIRRVEDQIQAEWYGDDVERLERELHERMDAPEFDIELDIRNIDDVIQEIMHDLGLGDPRDAKLWKRRPPSTVKTLWERAARQARAEADAWIEAEPFRPP